MKKPFYVNIAEMTLKVEGEYPRYLLNAYEAFMATSAINKPFILEYVDWQRKPKYQGHQNLETINTTLHKNLEGISSAPIKNRLKKTQFLLPLLAENSIMWNRYSRLPASKKKSLLISKFLFTYNKNNFSFYRWGAGSLFIDHYLRQAKFVIFEHSEYRKAMGIPMKVIVRDMLGGKGFLLHAAGLLQDNNAYIFAGNSGEGKSTITNILAHKCILSDETIIVKKREGVYIGHSTPWNSQGRFNHVSASGPIKACFFIKKSRRVYFKSISPANTFLRLADNMTHIPAKSRTQLKTRLNMLADFSKKTCFYQMYFRKDDYFWTKLKKQVIDAR